MHKQFYNFVNFLLGLLTFCALLNSLLLIWHPLIVQSSEYMTWFIVTSLLSIATTVFMVRYYYYKRFMPVFAGAGLSVLAHLCFFLLVVILWVTRDMRLIAYYRLLQIIFVGSTILYAISLSFSAAGKRFWLKFVGLYGLLVGLPIVFIMTYGQPAAQHIQLNTMLPWLLVVGSLTPVPFILNFIAELKSPDTINTPRETGNTVLMLSGMVVLFFVGYAGIGLRQNIYWGQLNFERAQKLYQLMEGRTFVNSKGDTLFYRILKPLNYDPHKKYPLVVCLPYGGQPGTDKIRQIEGTPAAELLTTDENRKKYPAFIFVPNCPAGSGWGGVPNYPSVDTLVYKAIEALDTVFSIDVKRRYVTGLSRGGYGAWHFICMRPDMFAAAIPVSGAEDPKFATRIVDVAVWAFHGAKDKNVPVSGSRNMIKALQQAGGHPKYTEYPNQGHGIWYSTSITPGLWDWLFAQKRG
jgi:hypothetical protein